MNHIILEWPIDICLFLYYHFTLIQLKTTNVSFVTDNSSMTTESIPTSLLVEPCTLCDDGGTFDYKETDNVTDLDDNKKDSGDSVLDDTVLELYNCTQEVEQLNDKNTYFLWWFSMLSVDECTDLKERCIDCHLKK